MKKIIFILLVVLGIAWFAYQQYETSSGPTVTARINETGEIHGVTLIPQEIIEDSRCPLDVQCIWAGTVRLRVQIGTESYILKLAETQQFDDISITLSNVAPTPKAGIAIPSGNYLFTFTVTPQEKSEQ